MRFNISPIDISISQIAEESPDCTSSTVSKDFDRLITEYRSGLVSEIICSDLTECYVVFGIFMTLLHRNIWFHFFAFEISDQLASSLSLWIVNSDRTQLSLWVIWDETSEKDLPAWSLWWASKHLNRWSAVVHLTAALH